MLVLRGATTRITFSGNPIYTWVERGTVRVKCLRARTRHRASVTTQKCACTDLMFPLWNMMFPSSCIAWAARLFCLRNCNISVERNTHFLTFSQTQSSLVFITVILNVTRVNIILVTVFGSNLQINLLRSRIVYAVLSSFILFKVALA